MLQLFHKGVSQFRVSPVSDSSNSIGIAVNSTTSIAIDLNTYE